MKRISVFSRTEDCSQALGRRIGEILEPGDILALRGELGAGKTLFARNIAYGLGVPPEIPITSPTFTVINEYEGRLHIYHLDLYRLTTPEDLESIPWQEALYGGGVSLIEWPERMEDALPEERWDIHIEVTGDTTRTFVVEARGDTNMARSGRWEKALAEVTAMPECA